MGDLSPARLFGSTHLASGIAAHLARVAILTIVLLCTIRLLIRYVNLAFYTRYRYKSHNYTSRKLYNQLNLSFIFGALFFITHRNNGTMEYWNVAF